MGNKKNAALLEEGTVRQFMKLANLKPLAEDFINEAYEEEAMEEQEEDFAPAVSDEEPPMMGDEEAAMAPEEDAEVSLTDEEAGVLIGLGDKLAASGAGASDDMEADMEADMEMDMGAPEEDAEMMEMAHEKTEGMGHKADMEEDLYEDEDEVVEGVSVVDEDAIIKETFKRVANRLSAMKKEEQLVEAITRRVEEKLRRR
tara:strand:- start:407 stop:1009 length:603 start_codon:yes stop_codon:yes gene_type:complete